MPSKFVTVAVMSGRMSLSMPWRTTRETNSGNSTDDSLVWKNFSTITLISKRLSWR